MFNTFNDFSLAISVGITDIWLLSSIIVLRDTRPIAVLVLVLLIVVVVVAVIVVIEIMITDIYH